MSASPDPFVPSSQPLDADAIASRTFASTFRGWDPDEVRVHLVQVAEAFRVLQQQYADLERRLVEAEAAARRANTAELDPAEVAKVLGEETARVLQTARDASDEIREKAEARVAELTRQATDDAASIRDRAIRQGEEVVRRAEEEAAATRTTGEEYAAELRRVAEQEIDVRREAAETELAEQRQAAREEAALLRAEADEAAARTRELADTEAERVRADAQGYDTATRQNADQYAAKVRGEADAEAAATRAAATAEAERVTSEAAAAAAELHTSAEAEHADARARAASLVEEAQVVRERVLADLSKRRKAARQHLEQLRAARERLLSAYDLVRGTVEEATRELGVVLPEAKLAADEAARRVASEPDATVEQLEAELALARDADLPLVAGLPRLDLTGAGVPAGDTADESEIEAAESAAGDVEAAEAAGAESEAAGEAAGEVAEAESETGEAGEAEPAEGREAVGPASGEVPAVVATTPEVTVPESVLDLRSAAEARRKSGRLFRRRDPLGGASLPDAPLEPVDPTAPFEDVRLVGVSAPPEAAARPPADLPALVARQRSVAAMVAEAEAEQASAGSDDDGEIAEAQIEAAAVVENEEAGAEIGTVEAQAAPAVDEDEGEQTEAVAEPTSAETPPAAPPAGDVDDIFARIRASRAEVEEGAKPAKAPKAEKPQPEKAEKAEKAEPEPADAAKGEKVEKAAEKPQVDDHADKAAPAEGEPAEADESATAEADAAAEPAAAEAEEASPESAELSLLEKRDGLVAEIEVRLAKRVKRVLSDEQSSLLDEVRRSRRRPTLEQVLPSVEEQRLAYAEAATAELRSAVVAGVRFAGDVDDRSVVSTTTSIDDLADAFAEQLADPLRARIERALAEDPADGGEGGGSALDEQELAGRIRSCYREWRNQRVGEAVADAALAAFTRGVYEAYPATCKLRWVVDTGGSPCPDADDNALAGALAKGEAFPTGHACPPAHPGCRCLVVPADD